MFRRLKTKLTFLVTSKIWTKSWILHVKHVTWKKGQVLSSYISYIYSGYCSAMSCISGPKQPLGWGSPCHRLHMNSLRYSCYLLTIDQEPTDHRPSVDQLLTDRSVKYRRTIGEVSEKCQRSVGKVSVNEKLYRPRHIWKDYRPCLDRVSSDYRLNLDRQSTDYRPSLDQLSTAISTDRSDFSYST